MTNRTQSSPVARAVVPPALLVTVDTEEEGLWSGTFRAEENTVANIAGVPWFQRLCEQFGIRPTYLVDTPVVEDDWAVDTLRPLADEGRAEIGAHLHPWCAPPFVEETNARNSYLCNLPVELQRAKLRQLTERIEARFGQAPTSFRAARYGLDALGARLLIESGYLVDSSVIPVADYSAAGGPDFRSAPLEPYFPSEHDLLQPAPQGDLLEVPISVGFDRGPQSWARRLYDWTGNAWPRRARIRGVFDRLRLLRRIKCSPEQADGSSMNALIAALRREGHPCIVMMLHSSSLVAGLSPYARDDAALHRLQSALADAFAYCQDQQNLVSMTMTEFALRWSSSLRDPLQAEATS